MEENSSGGMRKKDETYCWKRKGSEENGRERERDLEDSLLYIIYPSTNKEIRSEAITKEASKY